MAFPFKKNSLFVLGILIFSFSAHAQKDDVIQKADKNQKADKKWFIVLPLRFTKLQDHSTMLSGIKLGRRVVPKTNVALSVYHSFYLNSFKAKANLSGFDAQPRLFINCVGAEVEHYFLTRGKFASSIQFLMGWGFMKYSLDEHDFESQQINYLAIEPAINMEYKMNETTVVGLALGYRPLLSYHSIVYSSDITNGEIPISKKIPNGLNIIITFKGLL